MREHENGEELHRESSPYLELDRATWAALASETESPLTEDEILALRGLGDRSTSTRSCRSTSRSRGC